MKNKLMWKKVKDKLHSLPSEKRDWLKAVYEFNIKMDYKKFGKHWGANVLESGVRFCFSIHPRITPDEKYKYQLLIIGLSDINGHIYVETIERGKEIAQEILDYFLKEYKKKL